MGLIGHRPTTIYRCVFFRKASSKSTVYYYSYCSTAVVYARRSTPSTVAVLSRSTVRVQLSIWRSSIEVFKLTPKLNCGKKRKCCLRARVAWVCNDGNLATQLELQWYLAVLQSRTSGNHKYVVTRIVHGVRPLRSHTTCTRITRPPVSLRFIVIPAARKG